MSSRTRGCGASTELDYRSVRIALRKISDERHDLTIVRGDGQRETVTCETRSVLVHDLLHHAVEAEAGLSYGFWACSRPDIR